ncbi:MAG: M20/M25/M40 family metallo-hydrolase [Mycobacteriaceae bacterium]
MSAALDLLTELVRSDTVGAREGASARRCGELLSDAGFTVAVPGWEPGREQLVALTGSGDAPLTLTGHLDTVPTGDPAAWAADPWGAERDGDRVLGRGTSDMKSGVAALLVAAAEHARRPHDCRGVQVVLTAGEETGCTGALALRAADLAAGGPLLVAEPTANRLVPGHKGVHWLELTAAGRAAHGSAPELGDNAVVRLARAAVTLHDYVGWPRHDTFGAVTANVGVLAGGVQPNVVPDAARLLLDTRTVPGLDADAHRAVVATLAGDGVTVADHLVLPVVDTAADDPFCALVQDALRAAGQDPEPAPPARFFTDASVLAPLLGTDGAPCPTVVLGPGEPDQCHVRDEWCSASKVDAAVAVYGVLLDRWCSR